MKTIIETNESALDAFVGDNVFVRTVTMYYTGELVGYDEHHLVLRNAAWIADTSRFANALATGELNEVEPYPDDATVLVGRGALIDLTEWTHDLPRTQK